MCAAFPSPTDPQGHQAGGRAKVSPVHHVLALLKKVSTALAEPAASDCVRAGGHLYSQTEADVMRPERVSQI
jgi:hypothetical protein